MSEKRAPIEATVVSSVIPDEVQVRRVEGRERIGELYELTVEIVHAGDPLATEELIYAGLTLDLSRDGVLLRQVHGIVAAVVERALDVDQVRSYTLTLVPRAHRLTLVATQDLYFDMSVPELIAHKLDRVRLDPTSFQMTSLLGKYPTRDFVVQFDETDLAFVSRLAEHVGLSFYFEQGDEDRMVFTDHVEGFASRDDVELTYDARGDEPGVFALERRRRAIPKSYVVMDYNYRTPEVELTHMHAASSGRAGGVFEYGTHVKTPEEGEILAKIRAEEAESQACRWHGRSGICQLSAGHRFPFAGGGGFDADEWLVVEVEHRLSAQVGMHGGDASAEYENRFVVTPASVPYRPERRTPRPRIHGLMHGIVEPEIWGEVASRARIDEQGRYWVKFLFDTVAVGERKASKPVRIALPNAGPGVGMQFPLRPGVEVVMGFIGGDPDRPIILGALHNTSQPAMVTAQNADHAIIRTGPGTQMKFKGGH